MANYDVRRVLIDQGSSCDIMYTNILEILHLTQEYLILYKGIDLEGSNKSTTRSWEYVKSMLYFGKKETQKIVKTKILVIKF